MFMGPGLVCITVMLIGGGFSLLKRVRTHQAEVMARLTTDATKLFAEGKLAEAKAKAQEAVELGQARSPRNTARAHFCLGRVQFRLGELEEAQTHLAKAVELDSDPHRKSLAAANLSLVLTRLGRAEEAIEQASEAVRVHENEIKDYPERFMRAGAGWANVALSLALSASGNDGVPAADRALSIFDDLELADGMADAHLAKAHALQGKDDKAAFAEASEAHSRFSRLHATIPTLYADRFADSRKLLDDLGDNATW
jgi:tetratricopeptide (TPR) repeat protein